MRRMRRRVHFGCPWGLALGLALVSPASADEFYVILDQTIQGQSNLFRTEENPVADGSYEIRPRLRFERTDSAFQYQAEYSPSYDAYFDTSEVNGFDQFGRLRVSHSPIPQGTLWARTDLAFYRAIRSAQVEGPGGIPEIVPGSAGRIFRGLADFGYDHQLGPATYAKGTLSLQGYDYDTAANADSIGIGAGFDILHELRPSLALGATLLLSHRSFSELSPRPASSNTVLYGGPVLRWLPTPTLTVELQAGPAWLMTDVDAAQPAEVLRFRTATSDAGTEGGVFAGCGEFEGRPLLGRCPLAPAPGLEGREEEMALVGFAPGDGPPASQSQIATAFARVLVSRDFGWGVADFDYFRAEDASSGSGATTIRDSVTGSLLIGGTGRTSLRLRANWNQRETVDAVDRFSIVAAESGEPAGGGLFFAEADALVVVDNGRLRTTQYWLEATLRRRIFDPLTVELSFRYLHQDRVGPALVGVESFDDVRGGILFRFEFPHLRYPL